MPVRSMLAIQFGCLRLSVVISSPTAIAELMHSNRSSLNSDIRAWPVI